VINAYFANIMFSSLPVPTSEQIDLISTYMTKWIKIATSIDRINRINATEIIYKIYNLINIESPVVLFADSPYDAYLMVQDFIEKQNYADIKSLSQSFTQRLKGEVIRPVSISNSQNICFYPTSLIHHPDRELRNQLYNQLHFSILRSVSPKSPKLKQLSGTTFGTQPWRRDYVYIAIEDWACDGCYLDWLFNCLKCEHDAALWDLFESLLTECGWIFPFEEVCIVSERPTEIHFDENKCLHAEGKPALVFLDGSCDYAHHGVYLPEKYGMIFPQMWRSELYSKQDPEFVKNVVLEEMSVSEIDKNWVLVEQKQELKKLIVRRLKIEVQSLNNAQVDALENYRQKWRDLAFRTTSIDRQQAASAIRQFYNANESAYEPEIVFVDSPYVGRKLVKKKCRGQGTSFGVVSSYDMCNGFVSPLDRIWSSIIAQLSESVAHQIRDALIIKRSWELDPQSRWRWTWVQPEKLSVWFSLFDFCISVLGCVHDAELWAISQAVFIECGWFYPAQRTCIICDRPIQISVDSQERLHHESEAAIIYVDGYRLRALHGLHPKQYFDPDKHKLRMQGYEV
jgi:hypothetical protein